MEHLIIVGSDFAEFNTKLCCIASFQTVLTSRVNSANYSTFSENMPLYSRSVRSNVNEINPSHLRMILFNLPDIL